MSTAADVMPTGQAVRRPIPVLKRSKTLVVMGPRVRRRENSMVLPAMAATVRQDPRVILLQHQRTCSDMARDLEFQPRADPVQAREQAFVEHFSGHTREHLYDHQRRVSPPPEGGRVFPSSTVRGNRNGTGETSLGCMAET